MINWDALLEGATLVFSFGNLALIVAGLIFGVVLGAIPGFTGSIGIALMLPVVFTMEPLPGLVFLLSIYTGGLFGGAVTAVLLNTPGTASSLPTALAGYPMTLRGEGGRALGVSIAASATGGLIGVLILIMMIEPLSTIALRFGPPELFLVALFGLTIIAVLRGASPLRTLYAGLLGVLLGSIGQTSGGAERGTFGSVELLDGVPLIPALIGLFAITELFKLVERPFIMPKGGVVGVAIRDVLSGVKDAFKYPVTLVRSSFIGVGIGAVPAAGATVASLISYSEGRRWSRRKKEYDEGSAEGVVASESADNASEGGSLATMLVLGIPGSTATAMILGAIIMIGWTPGPRLFMDNADVLYGVLAAEVIAEILLLPVGILFALFAVNIVRVPTKVLVPMLALLCLVGAISLRGLVFDAFIVLGFGVLGWYLSRHDFPVVAILLGLILGPIAGDELVRTQQMAQGQPLSSLIGSPESLTLMTMIVLVLAVPLIKRIVKSRRGDTYTEGADESNRKSQQFKGEQ